MLTARDDTIDHVKGLGAGADDYVVKPFTFAVLAARVKALLRRCESERPEVLHVDGLTLDTGSRQARRGDRAIEFTSTEYEVLPHDRARGAGAGCPDHGRRGHQDLSEYRSHHLAGDIAYARAVAGVNTVRHVVVQRDVALVSSTSIVDDMVKERRVNTAGAEFVVLSRQTATAP